MSTISSRVSMKHRCTIRRMTGTKDSHGGDTQDWATLASDVHCLGWEGTVTGQIKPAAGASPPVLGTLSQTTLILARSTDVTEMDQIYQVTDRTGFAVLPGYHNISGIQRHPDRLELTLKRAH